MRHTLALITFLIAAAFAADSRAEGVPDQVWFHSPSAKTEAKRTEKYGLPKYASATSRLEAELQGAIELSDLPRVRRMMDELAASPAKAARLLGKGYRVVQIHKTPRKVWDRYVDTKDGALAESNASMRIRSENGIDKLNFKPPTAERFPDGVAHRIESGINLPTSPKVRPAAKILAFLRTSLADNPLRELGKLYPGRDVAEFFVPAADLRQKRAIYEIQRNGAKVGEFTVDRVTARDPANPGKTVAFARVELEGDHITLTPTAAQAARAAKSTWRGPHRARDTRNQALVNSPEVKDVHRMSQILSGYLGARPAGMSKYAQARQMLGKNKGPAPRATRR